MRPFGRRCHRHLSEELGGRCPSSLAALSNGDDADVKRRLELAADGPAQGEQARRLADIALSAGLLEISDDLLAKAGNARGLKSARARRLWYDGDLSGAVKALDGSGAAGRRQQARLAGEAAVYAGAAPSLQRQDFDTGSRPGPAFADQFTAPHRQRLRPEVPLHHGGPAGSGLGRAGGHAARATPCRWGSSWRGPPTWWTASVTGASSRHGWPAPWTRVCSNRPRNCCGWPWNSGRASCTPPRTSSMDWWSGPWPRPWGFPWVYEVRGQLADTWAATRGPAGPGQRKVPLFQDRETEVMRDADLVVTLGHAMKANIVAAGIPGREDRHRSQCRGRGLPRPAAGRRRRAPRTRPARRTDSTSAPSAAWSPMKAWMTWSARSRSWRRNFRSCAC